MLCSLPLRAQASVTFPGGESAAAYRSPLPLRGRLPPEGALAVLTTCLIYGVLGRLGKPERRLTVTRHSLPDPSLPCAWVVESAAAPGAPERRG